MRHNPGVCKRGHPLSGENLYVAPKTGVRGCKTCRTKCAAKYHINSLNYINNVRFGGNREKAIQRDGEKCVNCGMTRQEHKAFYKRDITVDHIDRKGRNTPPAERNHSLENLQTLCLGCHGYKDILVRYGREGVRNV